MKTLPVLPGQATSSRPSPVEIWQILLSRLLDQHYGLTLNDTPFADERVIEQHIEAGISLCDAVNFLVEKYALVLPTSRDSAPVITMELQNFLPCCIQKKAVVNFDWFSDENDDGDTQIRINEQ